MYKLCLSLILGRPNHAFFIHSFHAKAIIGPLLPISTKLTHDNTYIIISKQIEKTIFFTEKHCFLLIMVSFYQRVYHLSPFLLSIFHTPELCLVFFPPELRIRVTPTIPTLYLFFILTMNVCFIKHCLQSGFFSGIMLVNKKAEGE